MKPNHHESLVEHQRDLSINAKRFIAVAGVALCMTILIAIWAYSLRETIAAGIAGSRTEQNGSSVLDEVRATFIELREATSVLGEETTASIEAMRRDMEAQSAELASEEKRSALEQLKRTLESQPVKELAE